MSHHKAKNFFLLASCEAEEDKGSYKTVFVVSGEDYRIMNGKLKWRT